MSQPNTPTSINLAIKGLYLNPSTFGSNAPPGALTVANNVVIDRPSVVATRRGFDNSFATIENDGIRSMYQYNNVMLLNTTDDDLHVDVSSNGTFTLYNGTYAVPNPSDTESRVRAVELNKNFYFITEDGTYRLDHIAGQPRKAGAPPGLSGSGTTLGVTGFLADTTAVAYRVVFGYKDYNSQLILGAPSSRIVVENNTGTATNVTLTFQVPREVVLTPTDWFFQVYRGNASPDLTTPPADEMSLTYEGLCANFAGLSEITIDDITPDNLRGAALYTNQGQDGILQSNYRPPWALDVCTFKQYTFYANTRTAQTANLTLVSAGASNGADAIIPGDIVTFTSNEFGGTAFVLTAWAGANNASLGRFQVSNTGNPAYDIQVTASNMALVANGFGGNDFLTAYYTSSDTDLPGKLRFERTSLVVDTFTITSSVTMCWEQTMPVESINDARANRICYSKFNQPEAVPIVNYIEVGSANQPIRRIVPLRDGVMVLKDDGVFRVSNAAPPFTITPIDYNVRILAANTAAELDNNVYFLSDQGVVALSDSDTQIMSFVLDKTIIENTSPTLFPNLREIAWGIAYQSDRKYILCMPGSSDNTEGTQQYVYNHLTQVWTRWTLDTTCGLIFKRDGKMYLGSNAGDAPGVNNSYVYQERKSFTNSDYADNQYDANSLTAEYSSIIVISNPVLPAGQTLQVGWTISQTTSSATATITNILLSNAFYSTVELDKEQTWKEAPVLVYVPIHSEIETIQVDCQNPGMNKQFNEAVYIFTEQSFSSLTVKISSNTSSLPISDTLVPTIRGGWGLDPWGTTPWGGIEQGQGKIRRYIPTAIQRAGWLYFNITNAKAFTKFGLSGIEVFYKQTSSRQF
jgi:hypothetical protein